MSANQIQLKGQYRLEEAIGDGIVKPGMVLELTSAGKVKAHSTEGGVAERLVAVEDALQGKSVFDAYSDGDRVIYHVETPGAETQVLVKAGSNVSIGEKLISAADGTFIPDGDEASATTSTSLTCVALEAADLTNSGDVDTLVAVRWL